MQNLICAGDIPAQTFRMPEKNRLTTHATLFGIGKMDLLDTYLSPFSYTGPQINIMHERIRRTHWADYRVSVQSIFYGDIGYTHNPAQTANMLSGNFAYQIGWHYNWTLLHQIRILAGGALQASLGGIYNTRNSNNPAQAKASVDLAASCLVYIPFHIRSYPFAVKYQLDIPVSGIAFSPNYNQSYYELFSLGHYDHNIVYTWPGNAPTFRQWLTVDIPIKGFTFRFGYQCMIEQNKLNHLKWHQYSHSFMLGYVKDFYFLKRKEQNISDLTY